MLATVVLLSLSLQPSSAFHSSLPSPRPARPFVRSPRRVQSTRRAAALAAPTTAFAAAAGQLPRRLFLSSTAAVYAVAFLVALRQNRALIGDGGITPAKNVLDAAEFNLSGGPRTARRGWEWWGPRLGLGKFNRRRPNLTLLWGARDRENLDRWLDGVALTGLVAATAAATGICCSAWLFAVMWVVQHSLVAVGGHWWVGGRGGGRFARWRSPALTHFTHHTSNRYGFGWESQVSRAEAVSNVPP